jgi:hypothetical protein
MLLHERPDEAGVLIDIERKEKNVGPILVLVDELL